MPVSAIVNRALAVLFFVLMVPQFIATRATAQSSDQQMVESTATTSSARNHALSDREKAELLGPVEEYTQETFYPPQRPGLPAFKASEANKYYPDGSLYQHTDYEGIESFTYDAQGRLVAEDWDPPDRPGITYSYDAQGRLTGITGEEDQTTTFEYDAQGRKIRIVKSNVQPSPSSIIYILNSFGDDLSVIPPVGGQVKTLFNDRDQAIESEVYEANGDLRRRFCNVYDAKGRLAKSIVIDTSEQLAADPAGAEGTTSDAVTWTSFYAYDDKDRLVEQHEYNVFFQEEIITKSKYNDHGDLAEESRTTYTSLNQPDGAKVADTDEPSSDAPSLPSATPESYILQFSYQYDSFGNWIEETEEGVSCPASEHVPCGTVTITHRTIAYY